MKEKNKRRFTTWLATLGFASFCGLLAFGSSLTQEYKRSSAYSVDGDGYITLTKNEFETYTYDNLGLYWSEAIEADTQQSILPISTSYMAFIDDNGDDWQLSADDWNDDFISWQTAEYGSIVFSLSGNYFYADTEIDYLYVSFQCDTDYYYTYTQLFNLDIQANTIQERSLLQILADFVDILVSGIVTLGTGVANGIVAMAQALFLTTSEGAITGLSVFGGIIAIFAGLALAIGITTRVYTWVTSLGN